VFRKLRARKDANCANPRRVTTRCYINRYYTRSARIVHPLREYVHENQHSIAETQQGDAFHVDNESHCESELHIMLFHSMLRMPLA
jgi:hypothetical protein